MTEHWRSAYVYLDIDDPVVAWMVYRAELVSAPHAHQRALSVFTTRRLSFGRAAYERERAIEELRRRSFPDAVSRLAGFYAFPDQESARAAMSWGLPAFRGELLAEIVIDPISSVSQYDAEWITRCRLTPDQVWAASYFGGEPSLAPIWELLIDGRAVVYGTEIRKRAYNTVKATWPASLPLLELARVAVELRSDLGLITAAFVDEGDQLAVRYVMNFADATNPVFLERFAAFDGPKNTQDLTPSSDLVVPDLSDSGFSLS
jgi:hypothetical protein